MSDQFNPKRFARGVKLTREHLTDPLDLIQTVANRADVDGVSEHIGVSRSTWIIPWLQSPNVYLPFPMPPFQEMFDRATLQDPDYPITLMDLSLSFDQRGEALAVCGSMVAGETGLLMAPDMSRLDMTMTLCERTPTVLSNPVDTTKYREVLRVELSGEDVFGNAFAKQNPFLLGDVRVNIKPFSTYFWHISAPGLAGDGSGAEYDGTVAGAYVFNDTARITVDGTDYDYIIQVGDGPDDVAVGVAAKAAASPIIQAFPQGGGSGIVTILVRSPDYAPVITTAMVPTGGGAGTFISALITPNVPATKNPIALPSFTLSGVFCSPLTERDVNDPVRVSIQNMPTKHQGIKAGTAIGLTIPVANAVITGTDIQDAQLGDFDRTLRERAGTGYGAGFGALADPMQAADSPVEELPSIDAHYMMIVVPLWGTFGPVALIQRDVPAIGIPNFASPWKTQITDRRVFPVPENFVLHHAFSAWNSTDALLNTEATYEQEVAVSISSGRNADNYLEQMVAYLTWTGANYTNYRVDQYDNNANSTAYALLAVPIVGEAGMANPRCWNTGGTSGLPFFMGHANSTTDTRSECADMPPSTVGAAYAAPVTAGTENLLEVRWSKRDATLGLYNDDPATTLGNTCVIGAGGEWVILCGKTVLSA